MTVVVLEDAAGDLETGRRFYERREAGVGRYFVESLMSDLESLVLYAGIHSRHFGYHRLTALWRYSPRQSLTLFVRL